MVYFISYDLNKPGQNYSALYEAIKSASDGTWCKPLSSVYIIKSNLSSKAIYDKISPYLDRTDRILVAEFGKDCYWLLGKDISDYLISML